MVFFSHVIWIGVISCYFEGCLENWFSLTVLFGSGSPEAGSGRGKVERVRSGSCSDGSMNPEPQLSQESIGSIGFIPWSPVWCWFFRKLRLFRCRTWWILLGPPADMLFRRLDLFIPWRVVLTGGTRRTSDHFILSSVAK